MKCRHAVFPALLAIAFLASSCVTQRPTVTPTATKITKSKALELAENEFVKTGLKLEIYRVSIDSYDDEWIVCFNLNGPPIPAGGAFVTVEKDTGKTVFHTGD